jgi:hypothetical protein
MKEDPVLLAELFDTEYPKEHDVSWKHYQDLDTADFTLRGKQITIEIARLTGRHISANWVLEPMYIDVPKDAVGYDIIFKVGGETDITGGGEEFAIFSAVLRVLNRYLREREWDYLQFTGEGDSRNRLYQALAQRMTKSQPGVEHIAQRGNDFVITRF